MSLSAVSPDPGAVRLPPSKFEPIGEAVPEVSRK